MAVLKRLGYSRSSRQAYIGTASPARRRGGVLDFLMMGGTAKAAAERFGMPQKALSEIIQDETAHYADASEIKHEWTLASRRLLRMELAFHQRAMEQMDPTSAVIALKCNARSASLQGGGSAQPSHLIAVMQAKTIEEQPSSTEHLRRVLDELYGKRPTDGEEHSRSSRTSC